LSGVTEILDDQHLDVYLLDQAAHTLADPVGVAGPLTRRRRMTRL
jgi:hypothetical protein